MESTEARAFAETETDFPLLQPRNHSRKRGRKAGLPRAFAGLNGLRRLPAANLQHPAAMGMLAEAGNVARA